MKPFIVIRNNRNKEFAYILVLLSIILGKVLKKYNTIQYNKLYYNSIIRKHLSTASYYFLKLIIMLIIIIIVMHPEIGQRDVGSAQQFVSNTAAAAAEG